MPWSVQFSGCISMTSPDANIPPKKDPGTEGVFRTLWETVKSERMLSVILAGVGLICLMIVYISRSGVTADGIQATVKAMLLPVGIVALIILVLGSMRKTILGKTVTALILIYFLAGMKQFLFAPYPPPMPPFYCFVTLTAEGCPGSPKYSQAALKDAPTYVIGDSAASSEASDGVIEGPPVVIEGPPVVIDDEASASEPENQAPPTTPSVISPGPVFTQFAGSLQRERIVALAQTLSTQGWRMQGADRGGERTAAAAGTNEVRFFYPEDRPYAEALAQAIVGIADWVPEMDVVDLSSSGYQPAKGHLEIWTSG